MKDVSVIEISQNYVKIAAIKTSLRASKQSFFCVAKSITSLAENQISEAISNVFASLKIKSNALILSLPRNLVTLRVLSFPSRDENEISKMVDLNLVRVMPYKKEEMISSYSILETTEEGFTKILLCIAHKDLIEKQLKILTEANLFADKIYLSSYGVWEWILANCKSHLLANTVYLGLDVDYDYAELIVFRRDQLLFSRSILIEAEQLQSEAGVEKLIKEIMQTVLVFRSEYGYKKANKLFISGAAGKFGIDLLRMFEKGLEIPVEVISAFSGFDKIKMRTIDVPECVSVSAAGQFLSNTSESISFFVPELHLKKTFRENVKDLIAAGALIIYIFFMICGIFLGRLYNRQVYLKELYSFLDGIKQDIGDLVEQDFRMIFAKDILIKRELPLLFFREIYELVDFPVAIKNIGVNEKNEVTLRGEMQRLSDVFAFVNVLETSDRFEGVQTKYTRKKKTEEGEVTDFELKFVFKY